MADRLKKMEQVSNLLTTKAPYADMHMLTFVWHLTCSTRRSRLDIGRLWIFDPWYMQFDWWCRGQQGLARARECASYSFLLCICPDPLASAGAGKAHMCNPLAATAATRLVHISRYRQTYGSPPSPRGYSAACGVWVCWVFWAISRPLCFRLALSSPSR